MASVTNKEGSDQPGVEGPQQGHKEEENGVLKRRRAIAQQAEENDVLMVAHFQVKEEPLKEIVELMKSIAPAAQVSKIRKFEKPKSNPTATPLIKVWMIDSSHAKLIMRAKAKLSKSINYRKVSIFRPTPEVLKEDWKTARSLLSKYKVPSGRKPAIKVINGGIKILLEDKGQTIVKPLDEVKKEIEEQKDEAK